MKATEKFTSTIKAHLDEKAKNDAEFAEKYTKEGKSIDGCTQYILSEVMKMGVVAMSDSEVYEIAERYYDVKDAKFAASEPLQSKIIPFANTSSDEVKIVREIEGKRVERKTVTDSNQLSLF